MKDEFNVLLNFLRDDMKSAFGVTEPAAIGFSAARAYEEIGGELLKITILLDQGVYKNGFSCSIPGTKEFGNDMAGILGALSGNSDLGLRVLENNILSR